jgi:segregation and condensation protein A
MSLLIHLDQFEGPFDLLLHLIEKNELDIYQVTITEITDQYVAYVQTMQLLELDVASEFIVMAAKLLAMKSRSLLPAPAEPADEDDWFEDVLEEEEMRNQLVARLLEYKKYKQAAERLKEMEADRKKIFTKPPDDLTPYIHNVERHPLEGVSLFQLIGAFQAALKKQRSRQLTATVKRDERSVQECMDELLSLLSNQERVNFLELLENSGHDGMLIAMFLALLELLKSGQITVYQDGLFADIWIEQRMRGDDVGLPKD